MMYLTLNLFLIIFLIIILLTIRGIVPRYKTDILITIAWKILLPFFFIDLLQLLFIL